MTTLPLWLSPDFVPLPQDPKSVTEEQRTAAFPGLDRALQVLASAYFNDVTARPLLHLQDTPAPVTVREGVRNAL